MDARVVDDAVDGATKRSAARGVLAEPHGLVAGEDGAVLREGELLRVQLGMKLALVHGDAGGLGNGREQQRRAALATTMSRAGPGLSSSSKPAGSMGQPPGSHLAFIQSTMRSRRARRRATPRLALNDGMSVSVRKRSRTYSSTATSSASFDREVCEHAALGHGHRVGQAADADAVEPVHAGQLRGAEEDGLSVVSPLDTKKK